MNLLQLDFVHVGVQLGGGHIGMAEKLLYNTQVRSSRQEVCSETMTKGVGGNFGVDSGNLRVLADQPPYAGPDQPAARAGHDFRATAGGDTPHNPRPPQ